MSEEKLGWKEKYDNDKNNKYNLLRRCGNCNKVVGDGIFCITCKRYFCNTECHEKVHN